jgi:hypothetical protein
MMTKRKTSKAAAVRVALITKDGARLIPEQVEKRTFIDALRALGPLPPADRFPDIDEALPPAESVEL